MSDLELLDEIKDAAYEVRKALAPGYLESVYQNALMLELTSRGLNAMAEVPLDVFYKNHRVGEFRADIIVEHKVVLEIKAIRDISVIHEAQLVNYLVATGIDYGFLINYGGEKYRIALKTREYRPSLK